MEDGYVPLLVDLSDVTLLPELEGLCEVLAKNVHDVWARQRIAEGWTYGERRDDILKQTSCLVGYEGLPEREKDYDRYTAINT